MAKRRKDATYVHKNTLNCVIDSGCVVCLYKLFPMGYEEICDFISHKNICIPANQRPETCPRAKTANTDKKKDSKWTGFYRRNTRVLTVGDGDFSFSASIAQGGALVTATSHESQSSVLETYPTSSTNINALKALNVPVIHDVDATALASCTALVDRVFDVIIWNFPCVRHEAGADGQVSELEQNRKLLCEFFGNVRPFLASKGLREIHVTHKTLEPFSWWNIVDLAQSAGLVYQGEIIFDRCLFPGYVNRKALDKKSFPLNDARTFVFTAEELTSDKLAKKCTLNRCSKLVPWSQPDIRSHIVQHLEKTYGSVTGYCNDDIVRKKRKRNATS